MSIEKVRAYFKDLGIDDQILELDTSTATVPLAAKALGVEEGRIAKTLAFLVDDKPIVIVMAGDVKIANAKFKAFFHQKAKMLTPEEASTLIGHSVGGVCPFAVNDEVKVYLDDSLKKYDHLYPACGSSNSAIRLTLKELEKYSNATAWVDVSKEQ